MFCFKRAGSWDLNNSRSRNKMLKYSLNYWTPLTGSQLPFKFLLA
jgi:hypothetical protein